MERTPHAHRGLFFWTAATLGACAGCLFDPLIVLAVCLTLFTACVLVDVFCAMAPGEEDLWPAARERMEDHFPPVDEADDDADRPLVTLGQGDYEIHIRPSDLTDAEREALR